MCSQATPAARARREGDLRVAHPLLFRARRLPATRPAAFSSFNAVGCLLRPSGLQPPFFSETLRQPRFLGLRGRQPPSSESQAPLLLGASARSAAAGRPHRPQRRCWPPSPSGALEPVASPERTLSKKDGRGSQLDVQWT